MAIERTPEDVARFNSDMKRMAEGAARFYAELWRKRFFIYYVSERDMQEWQVREDHEWCGIKGGSGLIEASGKNREAAQELCDRLNERDAALLETAGR